MHRRCTLNSLVLAALALISLNLPASAVEWADISEAESKVYLALDLPQRIQDSGWNDDYSAREYRVLVLPKTNLDPRVEIYFTELAPGYFFETVKDARSALGIFVYLKNTAQIIQTQQPTQFGAYRATYVVVEAHGRHCVVFTSKSGQGGGDPQVSEGTSLLSGYYCNPVSDTFDKAALSSVLRAIGVKPENTSAPAKVAAPFTD